jgi:RNA polymerase sigma factor (sigma-70 family)
VNPGPASDEAVQRGVFATTRWSVILSSVNSQGDNGKSRESLTELCRLYWRPIFAFVCRRGYPVEDAEDLTQDFFVMILETDWLEHADPNRGRFRSFLLRTLQNFVGQAAEKKLAQKRGGKVKFVSWDDWMAEAPSQLSLSAQALESWSPERVFDLRWAATVVEQALLHLREECERKGRLRVFDAMSSYLTAERTDVSYAKLGASLGIAETAVKKLLFRLRERFRDLLRDAVAHTVENEADIDDEIRHLCAALAAGAE